MIDIVEYFITIYTPTTIYNTACFSTISPTEHIVKLLKGFWFAFLLLLVKSRVFLDVLQYCFPFCRLYSYPLPFDKLVVGIVLLISRSSLYSREIVTWFTGAVGPQLTSPLGKGSRGRFPPHASTFLCLILYSMRSFWILLGCQAQCFGTWDHRWIDKALRMREGIQWGTMSVIN